MSLNVQNVDLQKADISGSKWQEVNAQELVIENTCLAKSKVHNVNMSSMAFNDVNMEEVGISNANLSKVKIQHANLSHAVVDHVHLFGTEFRNVGFIIAGGLGVMYNAKEIGSTDRKRGFIVNLLWVCTVFDSK